MAEFVSNVQYRTHECGECGVNFAFTLDFYNQRLRDHKNWFCPNGHTRHFSGPSEADKLRAELERKEQMLAAANSRATTAETERQQVGRAHKRMRERVMNGVCPCCNRTFQNLMSHMKTEHPDFKEKQTVRALRSAFGMTQADLAKEIGINQATVSQFERGLTVGGRAQRRIDGWLESHAAKA